MIGTVTCIENCSIWSCVYRPYKESISKEMNNDNDLNLHLHYQMSGWLRYWLTMTFIEKTQTH